MSFEWTDELKADVIKRYQDAEPTADNSSEIVAEIAEELGATANGVRMILVKAEVYVKKTPSSSSSSGSSKEGATKKVGKADAQEALKAAISAKGLEPNDEIISKLTGKAALYLAEIIENRNND